jgi:hypothetical protein
MKRTLFRIGTFGIIAGVLFLLAFNSPAQNEIVRETRDVASFNQIDVGGAFEVSLTQGSPQKVEVEARQKDIADIFTEVKDDKLVISSKGIKDNTPLNIYITMPEITRIVAHGAVELNGTDIITAGELTIEASGAAEVDLSIEATTLKSDVSGAAELDVSGSCVNHQTVVSGAASLNAGDLKVKFTQADVSGAGSAHVNSEDLVGNTSGAGELYDDEGAVEDTDWDETDYIIDSDDDDTTIIRVPGAAVVVTENNDSVTIKLGNRVLIVDEDGNVEYKRSERPRFNGHWAGVDLGFNGYVNSDFNMNFPKEYEYMDLRMEKSAAVNLNFFEQNIRLAKNQHWGIVTGLGLAFNDYKFLHQTRLSMDSTVLQGYIDEDISIRKTKLSMYYLTLPVLFEYQTAPAYHKNGFHISLGVIIGARLSSHTKIYYNELNKEFNVTQYNPETGQYEVAFTAISPNDPKEKNYDDWFLQPFKFDASVRIGWNFLNFFATYSLNTMFRQEKGPELYPWSAGISLVCF